MLDQYGRDIRYMRISITDRCNLRCRYCMPQEEQPEETLLDAEEILRLCACAVSLGITRFKITGGEPLVRADCQELIRRLKEIPGVEQVTLTTNGLCLSQALPSLARRKLTGSTSVWIRCDRSVFGKSPDGTAGSGSGTEFRKGCGWGFP